MGEELKLKTLQEWLDNESVEHRKDVEAKDEQQGMRKYWNFHV